jgi:CHAT domain-containing protein
MNNAGENSRVGSQLLEKLLMLPTLEQQASFLQAAHCLHAEGLLRLLDIAAELARSNPGQARQLATICAALAGQNTIEAVAPPAAYIQAQTYALTGDFDQALALIKQAYDGYLALGQTLPALRTTAGLMHILGESGRYQEALAAGQTVLDKIGDSEQPDVAALAVRIQQNMGICYRLSGRYDQALEAFNAAETRCLTLGMALQASDISSNRGILLWEMGRGTEALAAWENCLAVRTQAGLTLLQAQSLLNIGSAHLLLGNYTPGLAAFESARRLFASLDVLLDQHVLLLDTANAYLALNLYPEALTAYQEANRLLHSVGAIDHRARALWGLGATLLALGQLDEAEDVLAEAVTLLKTTSDGGTPTPLLATILLEQAAVQAARNKPTKALTAAKQALHLVNDYDWPVPAIYAHLQLADLMPSDPSSSLEQALAQAERHLQAAQHLLSPLNLPPLRYRLQQRLGRLRRRQGRHQEAQQLLEAAIDEVERLRGTLAQETMRTSFLHDKGAAYDELIRLYLGQSDKQSTERAFAVAERAKSRTLLDMISGVMETKPSLSADTGMVAQLRQLQADLNAVYNQLLYRGPDWSQGQHRAIQARATELEGAIKQLQLRLAATDIAPDLWASPRPLPEIQAQLPPNLSLLVYHIIEDSILAFVVNCTSIHLLPQLNQASTVQMLLWRLAGLMDRMRAGWAFSGDQTGLLELSVRRLLAALYQALVAPLEDTLSEVAVIDDPQAPRKLIIIPHGCLHQVPFHALFDSQNYLIDRFEISYAPSATIYLHCQQRPFIPMAKALLLGVPDPSIPAVAAEVKAVAAHLPLAHVLLDQQATLAALQAKAADCQLLHLACHGLFRADNPMFSALKLHDGWLTATDAMQLHLPDALVTLSACESGRSQVAGGDELLGLLRAFLGAGAATVVVSLWLAQDDTTARLMSHYYARLPELGPAAALRAAQLALKAQYPHPYYWAPFIPIGRR